MASVSARECSASCNRTTYLRIGLAARARVTTRARSRGYAGINGSNNTLLVRREHLFDNNSLTDWPIDRHFPRLGVGRGDDAAR
jgi:hypothetical protein